MQGSGPSGPCEVYHTALDDHQYETALVADQQYYRSARSPGFAPPSQLKQCRYIIKQASPSRYSAHDLPSQLMKQIGMSGTLLA